MLYKLGQKIQQTTKNDLINLIYKLILENINDMDKSNNSMSPDLNRNIKWWCAKCGEARIIVAIVTRMECTSPVVGN